MTRSNKKKKSKAQRFIEFIDLTDVDEGERIRVKTSLLEDDPIVELPWATVDRKIKGKKTKKVTPIVENDVCAAPHLNHHYIQQQHPVVSPPLANNLYHNQIQNHVVVPQIIQHHPGYILQPNILQPNVLQQNVLQPNVLCYPSPPPIASTYPQQILIPPGGVYSFSHNMAYYSQAKADDKQLLSPDAEITTMTASVEQEPPQQNGDAGYSPVEMGQQSYLEPEVTPVIQPSPPVSTPVVHPQPPVSTPEVQPQAPTSASVVQNGIKSTVSTPPAITKPWASLFATNKVDTPSTNLKAVENQAPLGKQANNVGVPICPIKHPRISAEFINPDLYRMGEFLKSYVLDGKAVSLQPRGLLNPSNYCYINSILQALIACPPLYNLLSGLSKNMTANGKRKPTPVIDKMCEFVREFKHLPANLRVNNRRPDGGKNIKKDQGILITTDPPFTPQFTMLNGFRSGLIEGRQEDAEEFLGCLLNGLNDEMLELIKLVKNEPGELPETPSVSDKENLEGEDWQTIGPKNKGAVTRRTDFERTPINDIFGGLLKSRIHRTGDTITENIQPFFTLQLNIKKVKTVREALDAFVTKYQLEGVTSSKTNEEVEAWQQVMLDELPVVLVLHLKCFDFQLDGCKKIVKALEFPIDLKIDTKLLASTTQTSKDVCKQYKLFAVVYHDGREATKGHYTTDAYHVGYSSWVRYNDASVKTVQEEHVLKPQGTRVPYLLFYRRCDTIRSKQC